MTVTELDGQRWSGRITNLLLETLATRNAAMDADPSELQPELVAEFERRYDRVIREGWRENPRRAGRRQLSKAPNLLQRLDEHRAEVLRFIRDFAVPFTNNEKPAGTARRGHHEEPARVVRQRLPEPRLVVPSDPDLTGLERLLHADVGGRGLVDHRPQAAQGPPLATVDVHILRRLFSRALAASTAARTMSRLPQPPALHRSQAA
jgi:hypothetical protein